MPVPKLQKLRVEEAGNEEMQRKEDEIASFEAKISRMQSKMKVTLEDLETVQETHIQSKGKVTALSPHSPQLCHPLIHCCGVILTL